MTEFHTTLMNERVEIQNTKTALDDYRGFIVGAWLGKDTGLPLLLIKLDDGDLKYLETHCVRVLTGQELEEEEDALAELEEEEPAIPEKPEPQEGGEWIFDEDKEEWTWVETPPKKDDGLWLPPPPPNVPTETKAMTSAGSAFGLGGVKFDFSALSQMMSTYADIEADQRLGQKKPLSITDFKTTGGSHTFLGRKWPRKPGQISIKASDIGLRHRSYPNVLGDSEGHLLEYNQPITRKEGSTLAVIGARYLSRLDSKVIVDVMETL